MVASTVLISQMDAEKRVSQAVLETVGNTITKKCGDLLCQHESFRQTLSNSQLLNFVAFEEKFVKKKKKKKGNSDTVDEITNSIYSPQKYALALTDSIFFPEGGGQPPDQGTIIVDDSLELHVSDAQNINSVCVLTCQSPKDVPDIFEKLHASSNVQQILDWDRRFDFMTQHSAQHLISAVAVEVAGLETHSFSLQKDSLTSYLDLKVGGMNGLDETFKIIEGTVNDRIRQNLPMTPTWMDPNDPEFEKKVRSRMLPEGLTGKIRLVEIGSGDGMMDCNTCCGTHVPSLGVLQMIKFFKVEKVKQTIVRLHFAAGKRLLNIMGKSFANQSELSGLLSCTEDEHNERVAQLLEGRKARERQIQILHEQLCEYRAKEIVKQCKGSNNVAVVDLGNEADKGFIQALQASITNGMTDESFLVLIVSGIEGEGSFILFGAVDLVEKTGKEVAEVLGGRGGGRNGKFQGKGTRVISGMKSAKEIMEGAVQ